MFAFTISDIMHTKTVAPANSKVTGISVIKITLSLPQGELPLQENRPPALQPLTPLQQNGFLLVPYDRCTRRVSYAERRLSRYL